MQIKTSCQIVCYWNPYKRNDCDSLEFSFLKCLLCLIFFLSGSCPVIPESNEGKILTILYAAFGIPLLLFYLTAVGSTFSSCLMQCPLLDFRYHSSPSSRRRRDQLSSAASGHNMSAVPTSVMTTRLDPSLSHHQQTNELLFHHPMKTATAVVKDDESIEATSSTSSSNDANSHSFWPPLFCLILILIFIASGTCVFSSLMSLSTMDALLLSFMLLTTTGIPDAHSVVWTGQSPWPLMAVSIYIFLALTLCSICFSLIYEWLLSEGPSVDSCEASVESDGTRHRRSNSLLRSWNSIFWNCSFYKKKKLKRNEKKKKVKKMFFLHSSIVCCSA